MLCVALGGRGRFCRLVSCCLRLCGGRVPNRGCADDGTGIGLPYSSSSSSITASSAGNGCWLVCQVLRRGLRGWGCCARGSARYAVVLFGVLRCVLVRGNAAGISFNCARSCGCCCCCCCGSASLLTNHRLGATAAACCCFAVAGERPNVGRGGRLLEALVRHQHAQAAGSARVRRGSDRDHPHRPGERNKNRCIIGTESLTLTHAGNHPMSKYLSEEN